jgi:hypothetical protein
MPNYTNIFEKQFFVCLQNREISFYGNFVFFVFAFVFVFSSLIPKLGPYTVERTPQKNFQISFRFIEFTTVCIFAGLLIVELVTFAKIQKGHIVATLPCPRAQPRGPNLLELPTAGEAGG